MKKKKKTDLLKRKYREKNQKKEELSYKKILKRCRRTNDKLSRENQELKEKINELEKKLDNCLIFKDEISGRDNNEIIKKLIEKCEKEIKIIEKEYEVKLLEVEKKLLKDFLDILDILEISLNYINETEINKEFVSGIENTIKKFYQILDKYDVKPVEHENFNPEIHQAIGIENNIEKNDNEIIRIVQKGFIKNNKLIRPSLVIINKK